MFAVSCGQLPPASATRWKLPHEISTSSSRGAEHGDSQSRSMPSAPEEASQALAEAAKAPRAAGEAASFEKYSLGKFHPPTERSTLRPGLAALYVASVARKAASRGSTLMISNAVASVQEP